MGTLVFGCDVPTPGLASSNHSTSFAKRVSASPVPATGPSTPARYVSDGFRPVRARSKDSDGGCDCLGFRHHPAPSPPAFPHCAVESDAAHTRVFGMFLKRPQTKLRPCGSSMRTGFDHFTDENPNQREPRSQESQTSRWRSHSQARAQGPGFELLLGLLKKEPSKTGTEPRSSACKASAWSTLLGLQAPGCCWRNVCPGEGAGAGHCLNDTHA